MGVMKFRKKPVEVDAIQLDTTNGTAVADWCGGRTMNESADPKTCDIEITTLEGVMYAVPGDWIIKGVKGEFYPCKPDIFQQTYEPVRF